MNGGGQLWIESATAATGPTLTDAQTAGGGTGPLILPAAVARHPVMTQPYFLSPGEMAALGALPAGTVANAGILNNNDFANLYASVLQQTSGGTAVVAAQIGAGQIVADGLNIGGAISAQFNTPTVPDPIVADLKFVTNVITWNETHPAENKTSSQNAAGNDPASYGLDWVYPVQAGAAPPTPPGAAVWGNYIFVTDAAGKVAAFDINKSPVTPLWTSPTALGANASAPTVATYNGQTFLLVEASDGSVYQFDAAAGGAGTKLTGSGGGGGFGGHAPAPTYYDGRVYAGQADTPPTLYVKSLNGVGSAGAGVKIPLSPTSTTAEPVIASPAVGVQADGLLANDIVATVPTTQNMYTIFLGARADLLQPINGGTNGYNINRQHLRLFSLKGDAASSPAPVAYQLNGTNPDMVAFNSTQPPDYSPLPPASLPVSMYGDYDADFVNSFLSGGSPNNQTLNLSLVCPVSFGQLNSGGGYNAGQSAPAIDRRGDTYYTVQSGGYSYLFGVHHDPQYQVTQIKFRFRLPTTGDAATFATGGVSWNYVDADEVDYSGLKDFQFVGAPVVDSQGLVYVAAQKTAAGAATTAVVLCFSGYQQTAADLNPPANVSDLNRTTYTQQDEIVSGQSNTMVSIPANSLQNRGQVQVLGNRAVFFNFGVRSGGNNQVVGNMTEPQPVQAAYVLDDNSTSVQTLPLHTNLAWYTPPQTVNTSISGLAKVGGSLFFCDGGGTLYKVSAAPFIGTGKLASPTLTTLPLNIGPVSAAPSAGGSVMAVSGAAGIAALNQQFTVVADNNRILETDADGNAVWALDATVQAAGPAGTATRLDFNRPTSLSQMLTVDPTTGVETIKANDYLVADTGNNRCVRFDRDGNVLWELTRFTDTSGLLAAGAPLTLSQPSSVQVRQSVNASGDTATSYLIADSGNSRILEVTDIVNSAGVMTTSHLLTWASKTDQQGRRYRYACATYYPSVAAPQYVAAVIANTRLAPLAATGASGVLGSAAGEGPGGTILFTNYTAAANVAYAYTSFGAAGTTYAVRNPRFLNLYAPPSGTNPSLLYADDNGAFDLTYDTVNNIYAATTNSLHFTPANYQAMTVPTVGIGGATYAGRSAVPFVPTAVQLLGLDGNGYPRYLITQSGGQPELTSNPGRIGGEIFEVDFPLVGGVPAMTGVGGFGGQTLSRPGLTSPLTQPGYAIRTQQ